MGFNILDILLDIHFAWKCVMSS